MVVLTFQGVSFATDVHNAPDSIRRSDNALDHYLTGSIHEEAGDLLRAVIEYQVALLYDSTSSAIVIALAKTYKKLGYLEPALIVLESGRRNNPQDVELLELLSEEYASLGLLANAADCYHDMAEVTPLDENTLLRYAAVAATIQDIDRALDIYVEYTDRFGMDAGIYEKIGLLHLTRQDIASAETTFVRLIELDPEEYRILFVLGGFAVAREDWPRAEGYFRRALAGDSTNARFWSNVIMTVSEQEKHHEAIEIAGNAMSLFPEAPQFPEMRALSLYELGQREEAIAWLDSSIAMDSTRLAPYLSRGYISQELELWDEAAGCYDSALLLDAENPTVLNNYAYMLSVQTHRLEDALSMVEHALKVRPDTPSFIDTKGWTLYKLGRYKEALKLIKTAVDSEKGNAELYFHLGKVYDALGKRSKAVKAWRKAAQLEPDNSKYQELAK